MIQNLSEKEQQTHLTWLRDPWTQRMLQEVEQGRIPLPVVTSDTYNGNLGCFRDGIQTALRNIVTFVRTRHIPRKEAQQPIEESWGSESLGSTEGAPPPSRKRKQEKKS